MKGVLISQKDNFAANFGLVLRSSAIFWVKNSEKLKTTVSFSNYWKYKNNLDVKVILNLRDLSGSLIERIFPDFESSQVVNYCPPLNFEGSVEVEVFSLKNMRIPYAAVMAVYETLQGISMVHSYARGYSHHEIEDGRVISLGRESCWTIREAEDITSFCVFHNGHSKRPAQSVEVSVRNHKNEERSAIFLLPELRPYETFIIEPRKYISDLPRWLNGFPGNGRLSFELSGGFTRMLCGVKDLNERDLQVTHSNFDYSAHTTDLIEGKNLLAWMGIPKFTKEFHKEIIVYPDSFPGSYLMKTTNGKKSFSSGEILVEVLDSEDGNSIHFSRPDNFLPTRIVTGLRLAINPDVIPAECSLGVINSNRPPKHFSWMLVSKKFSSVIYWVDFKEVYSGCPDDAELVFNFYSSNEVKPMTCKFLYSQLPKHGSIAFDEIFERAMFDMEEGFGYLTVWCSYGGLMFFSTLRKGSSISIEHSF